jgi:hypothetical protein
VILARPAEAISHAVEVIVRGIESRRMCVEIGTH